MTEWNSKLWMEPHEGTNVPIGEINDLTFCWQATNGN